ncbi:hypothetical protein OIO90_006050 [Microbotryomycetes sp. JL221]|nr:hypothetical protein OIO90_006050 [Microbotryomycetes sp. JL221]
MRQKRVKSYRKVMQLYCTAFKFREPYQLLADAAFIEACVQQKLDIDARLRDVLQGSVKPMITQCSMQALYDKGQQAQQVTNAAKLFERRKCNHLKSRPEHECLTAMAGKDNSNRYIIATQSLDLRKQLRAVAGLPLVYISRSVMLLETPSDQTLAKKLRMEREKLHVPAAEMAVLKGVSTDALLTQGSIVGDTGHHATLVQDDTTQGDITMEEQETEPPKKKKRKGPKGPNPLSVKKKTKSVTTSNNNSSSSNNSKRQREDDDTTNEDRIDQKRKRLADENVKIQSLANRGEQRQGGEQQKKKRKRSNKKKGKSEEAGEVRQGTEGGEA